MEVAMLAGRLWRWSRVRRASVNSMHSVRQQRLEDVTLDNGISDFRRQKDVDHLVNIHCIVNNVIGSKT